MISLEKIMKAKSSLKDMVYETPIVKANNMTQGVYLKCENLQFTGSFKLRGAANFIAELSDEDKAKGVVAWSAGNHAQGVAKAAQMHGIDATIFIPDTGSLTKIERTRKYGANVILSPGTLDAAAKDAAEFCANHGNIQIPPYDHEDVIAGQATVALEIIDQLASFDAVVVPIGGGGLAAGIAYAMHKLKPECKVYGVEASGAASTYCSIRDGHIETLRSSETIADGIDVKKPGTVTFEIMEKYLEAVVTVSDDEIADAILELMEENHLMVEGAGAASYAAVMTGKIPFDDNVVCILSGGNLDISLLNKVVQKSLMNQNRLIELTVEILDKPGSLLSIMELINNSNGNVLTVEHIHSTKALKIRNCLVRIDIDMPSMIDLIKLEDVLAEKGIIHEIR